MEHRTHNFQSPRRFFKGLHQYPGKVSARLEKETIEKNGSFQKQQKILQNFNFFILRSKHQGNNISSDYIINRISNTKTHSKGKKHANSICLQKHQLRLSR